MISERYNCIYIHIPKTAGTSIEKLLGQFDELGRGSQGHRKIRELETITSPQLVSTAKNEGVISTARKLRCALRYKSRLSENDLKQYFIFSFVRNPWSRAYSWYENVMRDKIHLRNQKVPQNCTSDEFITLYDWQTELRPQLAWIENRNGQIGLDFIGRFESLQEDIEFVTRKLRVVNKLPRLVAGAKRNYQNQITDFAKNVLSEKYAEEIEMFEYSFEDESVIP